MKNASSSSEIREGFLRFFESKGHRIVASSPLVPRLDPTLLFANAGMNQFKGVFTGEERRDYSRAASSQKCVRAGGKHNDLENVGYTARHHTFFEMLGNFSFGDYFKREAIQLAWEFVTKNLKLDRSRLYVSVFRDDDEAARIWKEEIGVEEKAIFRFGESDNFWAMGDTGPCGPCSEIYFDQGKAIGCGRAECTVGCSCDRYLEFWNLVFMEFEQKPGGVREKLPNPSIDTGMGLERITAIVQGAKSNYDTDLFAPLLAKIGSMVGENYASSADASKVSMRVLADHIRAVTFLITDGTRPSNEGRGYVLRRIMRRAMRHGRKLGMTRPFLHELSDTVVQQMGDFFTELRSTASSTAALIRNEEDRFAETIDRGLAILEEEIRALRARKESVLPGETAFRLYDTYGFPIDLTADMLREHGCSVDQTGFDEAFLRHREKARGSWRGSAAKDLGALARGWIGQGLNSAFLGYSELSAEGVITALSRGGKSLVSASAGDEVELLSDRTPFYGESGGQVGDVGGIAGNDFSLEVLDTKKPAPTITVHLCKVTEGTARVGDRAVFSVDAEARSATAKNHTATHLLHAVLKEVLGPHVKQEGSLVAPERLRFDFAQPSALTLAETEAIEKKMNERIWLDSPVTKHEMPLDIALKSGAVALFDEKYGEKVRVISVSDYSKELCGGTHLARTGEIGIFKIVRESSVAAGVRRLEAFTGYRALRYVQEADARIRRVGESLGVSAEEIESRLEKVSQKQKELEKEIKKRNSGPAVGSAEEPVEEFGDVSFLACEVEARDPRELREIADRHLQRMKQGVVAIGAQSNGKAFVVVKVSKNLAGKLSAGELIRSAASLLGGSGGGRPEMAQAGGSEVGEIRNALNLVRSEVERQARA